MKMYEWADDELPRSPARTQDSTWLEPSSFPLAGCESAHHLASLLGTTVMHHVRKEMGRAL